MNFDKIATEYNDTPWPTRNQFRPKGGFAQEGRTWQGVAIEDIPYLFGNIIHDMHEQATYIDVLLQPVTVSNTTATFDITLRRINRGMCRPKNYPSALLQEYIHTFALNNGADVEGNGSLRLAIEQGGVFWDWPLNFQNGDEGFLEEYIETSGPFF